MLAVHVAASPQVVPKVPYCRRQHQKGKSIGICSALHASLDEVYCIIYTKGNDSGYSARQKNSNNPTGNLNQGRKYVSYVLLILTQQQWTLLRVCSLLYRFIVADNFNSL